MIDFGTLKVPGGKITRVTQERGTLLIDGTVESHEFIELVGKTFDLAPGLKGFISEYRLEVGVMEVGLNRRVPGQMTGTFKAVNA